jgi:predicted amidohydrolase YtcJ
MAVRTSPIPARLDLPHDDDLMTTSSTLIRHAWLVPVSSPAATDEPVDIRIQRGIVSEVAPLLQPQRDERVIDAGGRWAVPGLWDQHVHMGQWAQTRTRLDLSQTRSAAEVTRIVARHIARLSTAQPDAVVCGYGYRSATWAHQPTVAELDAVSGDHAVALISGDAHNGWLNSRALQLLDVAPREGVLDEREWFAVFERLNDLLERTEDTRSAIRDAVADAAVRGVVGIVDMELGAAYLDWPRRFAQGIDQLRVRTATYPDRLGEVIAAGLRSGQELPHGRGLLTMGPLKIISDGALNTRTAYCHEPYAGAQSLEFPQGKQNYDLPELVALLRRATECGLEVAVHAIGDAATAVALDAFASTGAAGSIEHAQLVAPRDITRMARLGVRASVQPAHLLDDRDVTLRYWPDRADRCFLLQTMIRSGVSLVMGSDAPVAKLDPWLAMVAAVHRSADEREPWNPAEALTAAQALAASTDGQPTVAVGNRGDVVLLDDDPLLACGDSAATAAHLRAIRVAATVVAGRPTHLAL